MEKRSCIEIESPPNLITNGIKKKKSMSAEENVENNINTMNFNVDIDSSFPYPGFDINDCCFDDEEFEIEMHQEVRINLTFKIDY